MPSIKAISEAFALLYEKMQDRDFSKTLALKEWSEREILPLVRTFLLGYFGEVYPESQVVLPGSPSGCGRVDFIVGGVAVEFAVRTPNAPKATLSKDFNITEIKKLLKYDGPAVLVLFDFSKTPYSSKELEGFRDIPSLGQGNHNKSPFNICYYSCEETRKKNIRTS